MADDATPTPESTPTPKSASDPAPAFNSSSAEAQAWLEEQTRPLRANLADIKKEKDDIRGKFDEFEGQVKDLGDLDRVRKILGVLKDDEDAQLLEAGNINQVLENRTASMKRDFEKRFDALEGEKTKSAEERDTFRAQLLEERVRNRARGAAIKAGVMPEAFGNVERDALDVFVWAEEQKEAVMLDKDGDPIRGKDGKTPKTVDDFVEELKKSCPFYWGVSKGGGGAGGAGEIDGKKGPDVDNMSSRQMLSYGLAKSKESA